MTIHPQGVHGIWRQDSTTYEDELLLAVVDVPDTVDSESFFTDLKQRLKTRFQQREVWITSYPVDRT